MEKNKKIVVISSGAEVRTEIKLFKMHGIKERKVCLQ